MHFRNIEFVTEENFVGKSGAEGEAVSVKGDKIGVDGCISIANVGATKAYECAWQRHYHLLSTRNSYITFAVTQTGQRSAPVVPNK